MCVFTGRPFPLDITEKMQSIRNDTCMNLFSEGARMRTAPFKDFSFQFSLEMLCSNVYLMSTLTSFGRSQRYYR